MAKVLVAEDDKDIRELIEIILRFNGLEVVAVSDGRAVIAAASEEVFDLILLDVRMPRMDGYEACSILRKMDTAREKPIVMLSALGQEDEVEQGMAAGADAYVVKPFTPNSLIATIRRFVPENE